MWSKLDRRCSRVFVGLLFLLAFANVANIFSQHSLRCENHPVQSDQTPNVNKQTRASGHRKVHTVDPDQDSHEEIEVEDVHTPTPKPTLTPRRLPRLPPPPPEYVAPPVYVPNVSLPLVSELNTTHHDWGWPEAQYIIPRCLERFSNTTGLPQVSVVISFHDNEIVSNVLRTLQSIIKRSPKELLKEIILIDDNSKKPDLLALLPTYIQLAGWGGLVRILHSKHQLGLIRARLKGIQAAQAEVVVVMDSHMDVQPNWLQPLLHEIKANRKTLATSYLDWLYRKEDHWDHVHGSSSWKTYFDWSLVFGFQTMSKKESYARKEQTDPVRSAVTVGTIWAMDRQFFLDIGGFDVGMDKWGGENLDLSIRVWLFDGRVINVPCSHAAHVESPTSRDYRKDWDSIIHRNYHRFALVWLDEYIEYFYLYFPHLRAQPVYNLSDRIEFRKQAPHNFTWFLNTVFPELGLPQRDGLAWGQIRNMGTKHCLHAVGQYGPVLTNCTPGTAPQILYWSKDGLLRLPMHLIQLTKDNLPDKQVLTLNAEEWTYHYGSSEGATVWFHVKDGPIIETSTGKCLTSQYITTQYSPDNYFSAVLKDCDFQSNRLQQWRFNTYNADYEALMEGELLVHPEVNGIVDKMKRMDLVDIVQIPVNKRTKHF